jgi:hypothetical protein
MLVKIVILWFLGAYSLDTLLKGYTTMKTENTFTEMKEYMYHCQEREDKLRERCDLHLYRIPEEYTFMENLKENYYINSNYYLSYKMEAKDYSEFMKLSYDEANSGSVIVFEDTHYTLKRAGVKASPTYSYVNQQYERYPQNPLWTIKLGNHILQITDIK